MKVLDRIKSWLERNCIAILIIIIVSLSWWAGYNSGKLDERMHNYEQQIEELRAEVKASE